MNIFHVKRFFRSSILHIQLNIKFTTFSRIEKAWPQFYICSTFEWNSRGLIPYSQSMRYIRSYEPNLARAYQTCLLQEIYTLSLSNARTIAARSLDSSRHCSCNFLQTGVSPLYVLMARLTSLCKITHIQ